MKTTFLLSLFIFTITIDAFSQKINSDAITAFWKLVDRLKQDHPLTDPEWNAYYNLYGNKKYMETNRSEEEVLQHRTYLELVFRPSLSDSLKKITHIKDTAQGEDIFRNLYYIKLNEPQLRTYSNQIASPEYLQTSINLAKKYLPHNKYNTLPKDLTVYIMAMTLDAAVQPPDMYFGIGILYDFDRFQKGAIAAHEFHHQLRKEKQFTGKLSSNDSASRSIIYQINNEGCADLVDKTVLLENELKIYGGVLERQWLFDSADRTVQKIDSCLLQNAKEGPVYTSSRQFRKLTNYSSGHMPGFYMANIIKKSGYIQELIDGSDNPFKIFYLYNKAATKDKERPSLFSTETIRYLERVERLSQTQ